MRIGLVLSVLNEEYQISVYEGIKNTAERMGWEVICIQLENADLYNDAVISHITEKSLFAVDCVIILTSVLADNFIIKNKSDAQKIWGNVPVISIGQKVEDIPSILVQTDKSMRELVKHLVQVHGYKKFLYIGGAETHQDAIVREKVFCECMEHYKKENPCIEYFLEKASFTELSAKNAVKTFSSGHNLCDIDAVVCANDNMAVGVYKFLKVNQNLFKNGECAVTGFDDVPQARFLSPALTTISQPLLMMGKKAVETACAWMNGWHVEDEYFVDSQVCYRQSCGCKENGSDASGDEKSAPGEKGSLFNQLQKNYIRAENMLKSVTSLAVNLNYAQDYSGIRYVMNEMAGEFECKDFFVLAFHGDKKNADISDVKVIFAFQNAMDLTDDFAGQKMPLGDFYRKIAQGGSLIFKYLFSGEEISGCIMYDAPDYVLPYINTVSLGVSQALIRIRVMEEMRMYENELEKLVEERTAEVVSANERRLAVEGEVLKISEMERRRFSNDLHDDICQRLAGISMLCKSYSSRNDDVKKSEMLELSELIGETLQCTRRYAHNSYPVELENLGLAKALENLCRSFELQSGILCKYDWAIAENREFSEVQKLNVFRIVQEALHNVMKHSGARTAQVTLCEEGGRVVACVRDDGYGMGKSTAEKKTGLGLDSMQYRANQIDGELYVGDNAGGGTCIRLIFS